MSCRSSPSRNKNTLLNIYVSHAATIQNYTIFLKLQRKYGVLLADARENAPRDCHVAFRSSQWHRRNACFTIYFGVDKVNEEIFDLPRGSPSPNLRLVGGWRLYISLKPKACIFGGIAQSATPPASKDNIFLLTPYPHKKNASPRPHFFPTPKQKNPLRLRRNGSSVI